MSTMSQCAGKTMIALAAGACGLLALAYPDWRSEVRAHDYERPVTLPALLKVLDILDNTQDGVDGDEPVLGSITYSQLGSTLILSVTFLAPPSGVPLPCDLEAEIVTDSPNPADNIDWAAGGILETPGGHTGSLTIVGTLTLDAGGVGTANFAQSTDPGEIIGAQEAGLRNYGHVNFQDPGTSEGCTVAVNQLGASRLEWITTEAPRK